VVGQRCKNNGFQRQRLEIRRSTNAFMCSAFWGTMHIWTYFAASRHCELCGSNKRRGSQSTSAPARGSGSGKRCKLPRRGLGRSTSQIEFGAF